MVVVQFVRVEKVSLAESATLKHWEIFSELYQTSSGLPFILGLAAALVSPQGSLEVGAGILEVFILLPLVLHQSLETFDPFLLTAKVANLVSFKVHDQTNVCQAGAKNTPEISDCSTEIGLRHLTCPQARTVWPGQNILLLSLFSGFSFSWLRDYFLSFWFSLQFFLSWIFSSFSSSWRSPDVSSQLQWIFCPSQTQTWSVDLDLDTVILNQTNYLTEFKPPFSTWLLISLKNKTLKTRKASRPSVREILRNISPGMSYLICQSNIPELGSPEVLHSCTQKRQCNKYERWDFFKKK